MSLSASCSGSQSRYTITSVQPSAPSAWLELILVGGLASLLVQVPVRTPQPWGLS